MSENLNTKRINRDDLRKMFLKIREEKNKEYKEQNKNPPELILVGFYFELSPIISILSLFRYLNLLNHFISLFLTVWDARYGAVNKHMPVPREIGSNLKNNPTTNITIDKSSTKNLLLFVIYINC